MTVTTPADASAVPLPLITPVSRPFWDGCREGVLRIQRCCGCGLFRFYPSESCHACASTESVWTELSGRGRIASWIVVHRSVDPAWAARVPFATGVVEIEEQPGCLIPGLIEGAPPATLRAGQPVEIGFERVSESVALPRWRVR